MPATPHLIILLPGSAAGLPTWDCQLEGSCTYFHVTPSSSEPLAMHGAWLTLQLPAGAAGLQQHRWCWATRQCTAGCSTAVCGG